MSLSPMLLLLSILALALLGIIAFGLNYYQSLGYWQQQLIRYQRKSAREIAGANGGQWWAKLGRYYPISTQEEKKLRQQLEQAGWFSSQALAQYCATKLLLGLGLSFLVVVWQGLVQEWSLMTVMWALVAYVIGSNCPEWAMRYQAQKIKDNQQKMVPDAIDLLVISVDAGLSLDRALQRVGHYLSTIEPHLSAQFLRTYGEMQVIGDPAKCLQKLAWRTGLEELERLANTLYMAQKYGSPLAETMRHISGEARQNRQARLEDTAGALPGKITLIQMIMIMLPMMVMIVAPTLHLLINSLR